MIDLTSHSYRSAVLSIPSEAAAEHSRPPRMTRIVQSESRDGLVMRVDSWRSEGAWGLGGGVFCRLGGGQGSRCARAALLATGVGV